VVRSTVPRRHILQKLFSAFPDGWPGIGLIILRFAVALNGITQGFLAITAPDGAASSAMIIGLGSITVGLVLLVGFVTPVTGLIATLAYVIKTIELFLATCVDRHSSASASLYLAVMSLTLVLLGPGAFSLDARLFGRREIIIPDGRSPHR
jgi:uncharacterized membrane protein YphA (DoxX/SURF4 family)